MNNNGVVLYRRNQDGTNSPIMSDGSTHALETMEYEHHEIHAGNHFFYKEVVLSTGGAGEELYFMFVTPNTTKQIHAKFSAFASQEFDVYILEAPTTTNNGSAITMINNYRDSTNTSDLLAYSGPTVTGGTGTQIWHGKAGSGKSIGVQMGLGYEIIAKRNTKYVFKLVKKASGADAWIDVDFWFYQHTPKEV
jgi:hypothetical protein